MRFCIRVSLVVAQMLKNLLGMVGGPGLIPGLGRSTGEGKGYPLQYSGLENSIDCVVQGVTKSRTRLSNFHFHPQFCNLSFHILTGSFTEERFLILIQFGVCMCVWVYHAFSVKSKIYLAASLKFLSYVFSKSCTVLYFTFKPVIHFELTFIMYILFNIFKGAVLSSLFQPLPICCYQVTSSKQHNQNVDWRLLIGEWKKICSLSLWLSFFILTVISLPKE